MFGFGKKRDSKQKQYEDLMKQAMEAQHGGDIVGCSELHEQADKLLAEMEGRRGCKLLTK